MTMILRIAWRNLFRHKAKTLVIGGILFFGAYIMTLGNGVISGLNHGLQKHIVNGFTGDIVLLSEKQESEAIFGSMSGQTLEPIANYRAIKARLEKSPYIQALLPAGMGYVLVLNPSGQPVDQYILGVDFEAYRRFFPNNLGVVEGHYPTATENGVLVNTTIREQLYGFGRIWPMPKDATVITANLSADARADYPNINRVDAMVFMGLSQKNASLDMLSPVVGVFRFNALNKILGFYSLVDIASLRQVMGYFESETLRAKPSKNQEAILQEENPEAMFAFDFAPLSGDVDAPKTGNSGGDTHPVDTEGADRVPSGWEDGSFNVILVKLKPGVDVGPAMSSIRELSAAHSLGIKPVPWDKAIGLLGQMAMMMKGALLVFVIFIFFVAIIIMMNTLSMATMERTSEIGMMRAVGAKRRFIAGMFLVETFLLAIGFGGLGIGVGYVSVRLLAALGLTTQNEMLQIFYGGDLFSPMLDFGSVLQCVGLLFLVTFIAVAYPLLLAMRITPLDAVTRE